MTQSIDLKELEREAYLSYHRDGLLDIYLGLVIVFFSVGIATDMTFLGSIFPPLGVPIFALFKRSITVPRIGLVNFSQSRKARNAKEKAFLAVILGVFLLTGVVLLLKSGSFGMDTQAFLKKFILLPIGLIGGILFCALGFWEQAGRYTFYAVLIVAAVFVGPALSIPHAVYFGLTGMVIIASGMIMLTRFLREYPLPEQEGAHDERY